jgi:hypothetical protein
MRANRVEFELTASCWAFLTGQCREKKFSQRIPVVEACVAADGQGKQHAIARISSNCEESAALRFMHTKANWLSKLQFHQSRMFFHRVESSTIKRKKPGLSAGLSVLIVHAMSSYADGRRKC